MFPEIKNRFFKSKTSIAIAILAMTGFILVNVTVVVKSINSSSKKKPASESLSSSKNFSVETENTDSSGEGSNEDINLDKFDIYRYDDPFEPVQPPSSSSSASTSVSKAASSSSSTSATSSSSQSDETPLVKRVYEEDGVEYAEVEYEGVAYTVTEGETLGSSSYQVLDIDVGSKAVTFLFGDEKVILHEGEDTPTK